MFIGGSSMMPKEKTLNGYVLVQTYVLTAITGLGYLALLWSTAVLLGGFVTSLEKKDFWCLAFISTVQASRIFNDLADSMFSSFFTAVAFIINKTRIFALQYSRVAKELLLMDAYRFPKTMFILYTHFFILFFLTLYVPVMAMCCVIVGMHKMGSLLCIVLSSWRIWQRDYGVTYGDGGDGSRQNLMPALDLFYSLVLCQGALYLFWWVLNAAGPRLVISLRRKCQFPESWGSACIVDYLFDTKARCWRDPASIYRRRTINYAVELLGSDSWEDYLSGARMLDVFIKHGVDVRSLLLPSRPKIQKLIDTLGWKSMTGDDREIRELAARIVASLAEDIQLSQFPGAIRCISSLLQLETAPVYCNRQGPPPYLQPIPLRKMLRKVNKLEKRRQKKEEQKGTNVQQEEEKGASSNRSGYNCNELILQCLTILERLALDHHNCRDICGTPLLLRKIKAPVCSHTMIQDIKINDWADVVKRSFKVLNHLICAPANTGKRLRREISTNKQAVRNLESILYQGNEAGLELQMIATKILTELLLDLSINLTRETAEKLIKKQLQIFLGDEEEDPFFADEEGEKPAAMSDLLKITAGRTLALLSANSKANAAFVMNGLDGAVGRLTEIMFDAKSKHVYRLRAAKIMEHLCDHHVLDKELVKETLLPKVLTEILSHQRELPGSKNSVPGNNNANLTNSAPQNDEENQKCSTQGDEDEQPNISGEDDDPEITEFSSSEDHGISQIRKERQSAFLSLTLTISDKVISADDFYDAIEKKAKGRIFVAKLKTIIEENCVATFDADSLRIVKLCGQIAILMMWCNQFAEHFKNQEFTKSLSDAKKLMSNMESCILFNETDIGPEMIARPLLSDLEEKALELVG